VTYADIPHSYAFQCLDGPVTKLRYKSIPAFLEEESGVTFIKSSIPTRLTVEMSMKRQNDAEQQKSPAEIDSRLTELMKAHLDDVTGGLSARHNQWKQSV
jgi:hypothetical protein